MDKLDIINRPIDNIVIGDSNKRCPLSISILIVKVHSTHFFVLKKFHTCVGYLISS